MEYVVNLTWDTDAGVWVATSDDIPGLVLESGSFDALLERVRFAAPELLEWNAIEEIEPDEIDLQMIEDARSNPDCWAFG